MERDPSIQVQSADRNAVLLEAKAKRRESRKIQHFRSMRDVTLRVYARLRQDLATAVHRAFDFLNEEKRLRRELSLATYSRWAERFMELGAAVRHCDETITTLHLQARLRQLADKMAPNTMAYACALLLVACEQRVGPMTEVLSEADSNKELRRFHLWLPFIFDHLWHPFPWEKRPVTPATPPEGTSPHEKEQAEQAFGYRPLSVPVVPLGPTSNPFSNLLILADEIHEEQQRIVAFLAGSRREDTSAWQPRMQARKAELEKWAAVAQGAAERTGFTAEEVEQRLNKLLHAVSAILLWQRAAPFLSREERERLQSCGVWRDPASEYLSHHYGAMLSAWDPVLALAHDFRPGAKRAQQRTMLTETQLVEEDNDRPLQPPAEVQTPAPPPSPTRRVEPAPEIDLPAPSPPKPVHNADFTMVDWFGTEYSFALGVQSSAVRALWEEWEKTGLGLHQETIRNSIDAERDTFRMDSAFRGHPAFLTMIVKCGDGRYKLAEPDGRPAPPAPKATTNAKNAPKSRQKRA